VHSFNVTSSGCCPFILPLHHHLFCQSFNSTAVDLSTQSGDLNIPFNLICVMYFQIVTHCILCVEFIHAHTTHGLSLCSMRERRIYRCIYTLLYGYICLIVW